MKMPRVLGERRAAGESGNDTCCDNRTIVFHDLSLFMSSKYFHEFSVDRSLQGVALIRQLTVTNFSFQLNELGAFGMSNKKMPTLLL
jgi:hypothetical protein